MVPTWFFWGFWLTAMFIVVLIVNEEKIDKKLDERSNKNEIADKSKKTSRRK